MVAPGAVALQLWFELKGGFGVDEIDAAVGLLAS